MAFTLPRLEAAIRPLEPLTPTRIPMGRGSFRPKLPLQLVLQCVEKPGTFIGLALNPLPQGASMSHPSCPWSA